MKSINAAAWGADNHLCENENSYAKSLISTAAVKINKINTYDQS